MHALKSRIQKSNEPFWVSKVIYRRLSVWLTWLVLKTPLNALAVTILSIVVWFVGAAAITTGHLLWGAFLIHFGFVLDHVDGEVARYYGTSSPAGAYLDNLGHYLTNPLWFLVIAFYDGAQYDRPWVFILGIVCAISAASFPRSSREHTVLNLVGERRLVPGSAAFVLAQHPKPWVLSQMAPSQDSGRPVVLVERNWLVALADRLAGALTQTLMFPGLLFTSSIACVLDGLFAPIKVAGFPVTASLLFLAVYSVITSLNLLRTTYHNYRALDTVWRHIGRP